LASCCTPRVCFPAARRVFRRVRGQKKEIGDIRKSTEAVGI
jgi:hypothetical protein